MCVLRRWVNNQYLDPNTISNEIIFLIVCSCVEMRMKLLHLMSLCTFDGTADVLPLTF